MHEVQSRVIAATLRAALISVLAVGGVARAATPPEVTVTGHDNSTHIVFTFPKSVGFGMGRLGDTLRLRFRGAGVLPAAGGDGHWVTSVTGGNGQATLVLAPGARVHTMRHGNAIVVDVSGPPGALPAKPAGPAPVAEAPPPMTPAPPPPVQSVAVAPPAAPPPPVAAADPAPPKPVPTMADAPMVTASAADVPPGTEGVAANLPFGERSGVAAFRRNGAAWVVFDQRRQVDFSALSDIPLFAQAAVQLLPNATVLRLPLEEGREISLTRAEGGWMIAALQPTPATPAMPVVVKPTRFELAAKDVGDVVTVPDAQTGQNLLIGTLRRASVNIPVARRVPAFVLEPTCMGVLVEPHGDRVTLRTKADGFVVGSGEDSLSPEPEAAKALADAAFLTRRFDIPTGAPEALRRRLQTQMSEAGVAPAQSRAKPRKAAATTMIALGMGVEAQGMLQLATEEDPRLLTDVDVTGLNAIAAILGGRLGEAEGITNPALDGSDEVAFWRAVRIAQTHEGAPEAASVFATTANLLLAYPPPLRRALLSLVVETMALGGAPEAADTILAERKDDPSLALARAIRQEAKGETEAALASYDALAQSRDRLAAARAADRATTLRLSTHAITPAQAAAALEKQFFDWRGDDRELDLRLRVASLRAQTGEWRPAFALLQETAMLYPDSAPMIQARMAELMTTLIKGPASTTISPLELVALTEENAELVANLGSAPVAALMADKLVALDLPRRAGPVIERMMRAAPVGPGLATLGVRLANLRLNEGDTAGAEAALADSNAPGLPPALIERRSLIGARIAAQTGHLERARALLVDLGTAAADDLRATLLTEAQDWPGAVSALNALVAKTVPPNGSLSPEQQDTLLRLASALSRTKDSAGLAALGARYGSRIVGPRADVFRLLTAPPVNNVGDLPRASVEMALAKAIPVGLTAMGSR